MNLQIVDCRLSRYVHLNFFGFVPSTFDIVVILINTKNRFKSNIIFANFNKVCNANSLFGKKTQAEVRAQETKEYSVGETVYF